MTPSLRCVERRSRFAEALRRERQSYRFSVEPGEEYARLICCLAERGTQRAIEFDPRHAADAVAGFVLVDRGFVVAEAERQTRFEQNIERHRDDQGILVLQPEDGEPRKLVMGLG